MNRNTLVMSGKVTFFDPPGSSRLYVVLCEEGQVGALVSVASVFLGIWWEGTGIVSLGLLHYLGLLWWRLCEEQSSPQSFCCSAGQLYLASCHREGLQLGCASQLSCLLICSGSTVDHPFFTLSSPLFAGMYHSTLNVHKAHFQVCKRFKITVTLQSDKTP